MRTPGQETILSTAAAPLITYMEAHRACRCYVPSRLPSHFLACTRTASLHPSGSFPHPRDCRLLTLCSLTLIPSFRGVKQKECAPGRHARRLVQPRFGGSVAVSGGPGGSRFLPARGRQVGLCPLGSRLLQCRGEQTGGQARESAHWGNRANPSVRLAGRQKTAGSCSRRWKRPRFPCPRRQLIRPVRP